MEENIKKSKIVKELITNTLNNRYLFI